MGETHLLKSEEVAPAPPPPAPPRRTLRPKLRAFLTSLGSPPWPRNKNASEGLLRLWARHVISNLKRSFDAISAQALVAAYGGEARRPARDLAYSTAGRYRRVYPAPMQNPRPEDVKGRLWRARIVPFCDATNLWRIFKVNTNNKISPRRCQEFDGSETSTSSLYLCRGCFISCVVVDGLPPKIEK